jgi:hypothetical protein
VAAVIAGMRRPTTSEYAPFYETYVSLVTEADAMPVLERQSREIEELAESVPRERETYRYAPDKWSIREVFGHMADAERVFGFRAFCISRGEQAALPSFDQEAYVARSRFDAYPLAELVTEFTTLRASNLTVLHRLVEDDWNRTGTASGATVSVRALAFILAGHVRHHVGVLRSRYGVPAS